MKKLTAVLTALVMVLTMGMAMAEEVTPFSLNGTYFWGMSESEIQTALGSVRMEKEQGQKLTYLDPDDHEFVFEDLSSEITFGLSEDKLVLIELDFDDRVASQSVKDALTATYGEGAAVTDVASLSELEAMSDPDEIDLRDDDPLTFIQWTAEDGTRILMITDSEDDEAKAIFYTLSDK